MSYSKKSSESKNAIIYTRVSTKEQADRGYSLEAQKEQLQRFCGIMGINILHHFQEDASAKTFNRPTFKTLLEFIKLNKGQANLLLVVKWDRFSRNAVEAYNMIDFLAGLGVEVQATEQPLDLTIPENKIVLAIHLTTPEVENDRRSLNTKAGMRRALKEGRWVFAAPTGYKMNRDARNKPILVPDTNAKWIRLAYERFATGAFTQAEVLSELQSQGFLRSKNCFSKLLTNPLYAGLIPVPAWKDEDRDLVEGIHQPIVDTALFYTVQELITSRKANRNLKPKRRSENLPLRGTLICRQCGKHITGSPSTGNGGTYYYYHCQHGCTERFRADRANKTFQSYLRSLNISPAVVDLYMAIIKDIFTEMEGDAEKQLLQVKKQLKAHEAVLLKNDERYLEGAIEEDSYQRVKQDRKRKIEQLKNRERELQREDTDFLQQFNFGVNLLSNLDLYFQLAPLQIKEKILGSIFPEKLVFDQGKYRTTKINEFLLLLQGKGLKNKANKKGLIPFERNQSPEIPLRGLEPRTS